MRRELLVATALVMSPLAGSAVGLPTAEPVGHGAGAETDLPSPAEVWQEVRDRLPRPAEEELEGMERVAQASSSGDAVEVLQAISGRSATPQELHGSSLPVLLDRLAEVHGGEPTIAREEADRLSQHLTSDEQAAFAAIVAAHLRQVRVSEEHALAEDPIDAAAVTAALDAHARLARASATLATLRACEAGLSGGIPGVLRYDLACEASTHEEDVHLLVDAGGDDLYLNNAGGASYSNGADQPLGAAAAIDLAGDDEYLGSTEGTGAFNGAGDVGLGLLIDREGDDLYSSSAGHVGVVNGAAYQGVGTLIDVRGSDTYDGSTGFTGFANGAGRQGVGVLVDLAGDDSYDATIAGSGGINGGADDGTGWLIDRKGADVYQGTVEREGGINGGAANGVGHLVDLQGDDVYEGRIGADGAVNGAGADGIGVLLDASGNDRYEASVGDDGGVNGGAFNIGSGVLEDRAGDDTYDGRIGHRGGVNGGAAGGVGLLRDVAGDDRYHGTVVEAGGVNGASAVGIGGLVDGAGSNLFGATTPGPSASNGATVGFAYPSLAPQAPAGVPGVKAVLVGGDGDDRYWSNGTGQGAGTQYGKGILYDPGGTNEYHAGPDETGRGLAQGAGTLGGLGVLLDDGNSTFSLAPATTGQGVGLQGVGLLLHVDDDGAAAFRSAPGSTAGLLDGAGSGLRLALGTARLFGPQTPFTCEHSPELIGASASLESELASVPVETVEAHVCAPEPDRQQPIHDPAGGEPMEPIWKPPVPCGTLPILGISCEEISPDLAAFLEDDEITMTTSGGMRIDAFRARADASGSTSGEVTVKYAIQYADRMCRHGCLQSVDLPRSPS